MMSTPRGRPPRKPVPCGTSQDTTTPKCRGDKNDATFLAVSKPRTKPRSATLTPVAAGHQTDTGNETPVRRSRVRVSSPGAKARSSSTTPSVNNSRSSGGTPAANRSTNSRADAPNGRSSGSTPAVNGRGVGSTPAANGRASSSTPSRNGQGSSTTPAVSSRSSCRTTSGGGASTPAANGLDNGHATTPSVNGGGGDAALDRGRVRGRHPPADDCSSDLENAEEPVTVQVGVRVRPLSDRERAEPGSAALTVRGDATSVLLETTHHPALAFYYDHVFWSVDPVDPLFHGQAQVYESMASPLLKSAFEGYNVCLLAYGQTGSGKTYSMMGKLGGGDSTGSDELCDLAGIIPRFCVDLFCRAEAQTDFHTSVEVSYYEIYQERIRDLLAEGDDRRPDLRVREHPTRGPHVVGLTTRAVSGWPQMKAVMQQGNRLRATASTGMNNKSSRSHSVLCLNLVQTQTEEVDGETLESRRTSQASLVDLAGSERAAQAHTSGLRLREGALINKSLLTLGKVISALVDGGRAHIPYRESALTWLLRESLGGNARTAMLATISPSVAHAEETLSTLRYACKANQIVNTVHVNEDPRARIIRELRAELERLRQEQTPVAPPSGPHANDKCEDSPSAAAARLAVARLRRQLAQKELELRAQNGELEEARRLLADTPQRQQTAPPRRQTCAAVPFLGQVAAPSLVQLLPDSSLSETVAYPLPEGEVYLGGGAEAELRLQGLLLEPRHCRVARQGSRVTLLPGDGASYVNGSPAAAATALQHGDRLVLAGEVYLRLQLPARPSLGLRPFADARAELARHSEQRLAGEQQALRARVRKELLQELEQELEQERAELAAQGSARQHQLEHQVVELQGRLEELSAEQRAPQPAPPPPERRPSTPDLSPFQSDLLEQIESIFGEVAAPRGTAGNCGEAAEVDALVTETNTLLRRLGAKATVAADLELAGGTLRPAATVTDRRHDVCTSWDLATLRRKVVLLRSLCEEAAAGGSVELGAVLDSRSEWQQRQQRRRSGRRRSSVPGAAAAAATEEGALAVAVAGLCAPLVHRGADWQADSLRALLLSLQELSDSLTSLRAAWQAPSKVGLPQALLTALTNWRRLETAYAGWRRGRLPAADDADSELERTDDLLSRLQNSVGFVYQGVSSGVASLVEQHLSDCGRLLGRFCRALGAAAAEPVAEEDDVDAPAADPDQLPERVRLGGEVVQQYSSGAGAAALHRLPELLRRCTDVERLISDVKHLPVESETAAQQLAAARKLAVRLRSWLLRLQQQLADDCDGSDPPEPKSDVDLGPLSAVRDVLSLLTRSVQRHCDGRGLDATALAEAARRLLRGRHQLGRADAELQQLGGQLAAAAAALLQLCRSADPSAAPPPAERRRSPSKSCLRSGHSPVKRRVRWGPDDASQ